MIPVSPSLEDRRKARKEAKDMGCLFRSFTRGEGNQIGMMGEILVHRMLKGKRVGHKMYDFDIVMPNGITVDVKTARAEGIPQPHYTARVYGAENKFDKLSTKCDVYFFVRCNKQMTKATLIGWLPAKSFMEKALFLPKGNVDPNDGKLSFADEYTLPISELNPPSVKITKRRVVAKG